ncbi:MAG TPA: MFS transporter [Pseudomonas sp.]|uniref:MFS transporter n=1 Tax=Pseudomonas sp. TaxID=306 RepID=UPI002B489144|nr:MFS transporter [Pseudomonas sp.]HKS13044.1 MFS transporter [Pseudomonas sp.]
MASNGYVPLAVTLSIQALVSMATFTVPVLAPAALRELGGSIAQIGLFVALIYLGAMLSSLLSGNWILRFGAIRVSQVCLLLCGAGLGLAAGGQLWCLVLSALALGAGYGPVTPASSHILARTTPAHLMGFMFSLKQTGVPIGGVLAGMLVPSLVGASGWRGALCMVAAACLVMAVIAQRVRPALDDDRNPQLKASRRDLLKPLFMIFAMPRMRNLALCSLFFGAMQLCLTTYLVSYLTHDYGLALVSAGLILALTQGAGVAGRLLWGWIADRWLEPRRLLPVLALIMAAASLLTAAFSQGWPLPLVAAVSMLFGATAIGWNGVYLAEVARLAPPGSAGQYTGGTLFFTYFGVVAGPPLFAATSHSGDSLASGYALFGVLMLVVALALGRFARVATVRGDPG